MSVFKWKKLFVVMIFSALRVAFVGEIENNFAGEQELYLGKISIFGQEKYGLC